MYPIFEVYTLYQAYYEDNQLSVFQMRSMLIIAVDDKISNRPTYVQYWLTSPRANFIKLLSLYRFTSCRVGIYIIVYYIFTTTIRLHVLSGRALDEIRVCQIHTHELRKLGERIESGPPIDISPSDAAAAAVAICDADEIISSVALIAATNHVDKRVSPTHLRQACTTHVTSGATRRTFTTLTSCFSLSHPSATYTVSMGTAKQQF